jgi:hypothetical protein
MNFEIVTHELGCPNMFWTRDGRFEDVLEGVVGMMISEKSGVFHD